MTSSCAESRKGVRKEEEEEEEYDVSEIRFSDRDGTYTHTHKQSDISLAGASQTHRQSSNLTLRRECMFVQRQMNDEGTVVANQTSQTHRTSCGECMLVERHREDRGKTEEMRRKDEGEHAIVANQPNVSDSPMISLRPVVWP